MCPGKEDIMAKSLTEMAAEIVAAQASHAAMSADEMDAALRKTFDALQGIKAIEEGAGAAAGPAAMDPKASLLRTKVICLECGKEFKQLTNRHLKEHGINAKEYRKKYGFSARQPLSAKTLTAKRRKTAKTLGLGERLQAARKAKAKPKKVAKKPVVQRKKKTETPPAAGA
jgi:predicted transcriptional regulator